MFYRCRTYTAETWENVEATSPIEAAAIFHAELPTILCQRLVWPRDGDDLLFLLVDVEGHFEGLLSRLRVPRKLAGRTPREPWADHREEVARAVFWQGTLDELVDTWPKWGDVDREVTRNMSQRTEAFYFTPATQRKPQRLEVCYLRPTLRAEDVISFVSDLVERTGQEVSYSRSAGTHVVTTTGDARAVAAAARGRNEVLCMAANIETATR